MSQDTLQTLLFESAACRAQAVKLEDTWQQIRESNQVPVEIQQLLGQLVAASALLSASLKFEGSLILQIQGDGPVRLLVAECNNALGIRATVKMREDVGDVTGMDFQSLVNKNNKGLCVLILDPKNRQPGQQPYQGIVPLTGDQISDALESYMKSSEQLETKLILFSGQSSVAGLLLQEMPKDGGKAPFNFDPDGWERLQALGITATEGEMLTLPLEECTFRFFADMSPTLLASRHPQFECTCSRHKVEKMLINLGQQEVNDALASQKIIAVQCDFCNAEYAFSQTDCDTLFQQGLTDNPAYKGPQEPDSPTLH